MKVPGCENRNVRKTTILIRLRVVAPLFALGTLASCASPVSRQDRANFEGTLDAGDYRTAATIAESAGQITPDGHTQNIVWSLNAGEALFESGDMKAAIPVFDQTEQLAQTDDLDKMHAAIDYRYTTYDGVMTNVYKAMAFLGEGDRDGARVEFNRAEDRQRKAEEHFQREAAYAAAHNQAAGNPQFAAVMASAQQNQDYANATSSLTALAVYAPFENPFATYLGGIFFVSQGDYGKGMDRLRRAAVVLGPDSPAAADVIWAQQAHRAARRGTVKPQVWVVFENGQSATYHEMRLVLPMVTGQPMTLALPVLAQNAPAYAALQVTAGTTAVQTAPAGSFDAVMASEFNRRRPVILAEAVAEVLVKNVTSEVAQQSKNPWLQLASTIVANVSTADTRSWIGLPKEFQAVRIDVPADGHLLLAAAGGQPIGEATVPTDKSSIVWVKAQQAGAHPAIQVFPL
jgi:hypothetical protein